MFRSENYGKISLITQPEECIVWSVPADDINNCLASQLDICIESPSFSFHDNDWRMTVEGKNRMLGLYLWKISCKFPIRKYEVKLSLKRHEDGVVISSFVSEFKSSERVGKPDFLREYDSGSIKTFYCFGKLLDFYCEMTKLENDDVSFQKEDAKISPTRSLSEVKNDGSEAEGVERLVQNLKKLLLDGQNSDLILKVENREFPVHRAILSARSPVFSSMFQHDMTETRNGVVDIPDCTPEAFEVFLLYVYTGSADIMSRENVFNLYYAADKYSVHDLRKDCVGFMEKTLSLDTFCQVITLSLSHGESELLKTATHFFSENMKEVIKTVQWQTYIQKYPIQANELLIKAMDA